MKFPPPALRNQQGLTVKIKACSSITIKEGCLPDLNYLKDMSAEHQKPRTRSTVTIWNLPDCVLVHTLKGFHIKDVFNFQCVSEYF